MSHITMLQPCGTRTLANMRALLLGVTQVHPQQLVCMKIPLIEQCGGGQRCLQLRWPTTKDYSSQNQFFKPKNAVPLSGQQNAYPKNHLGLSAFGTTFF